MPRSREPGAAQRGAQAVAPDLALVKDEMDAEEYDMSQHGQEPAPLPDQLAVKYEIEIEDHGLQQHLQPDLSRVKVEVDIEEHDFLQQKNSLNCCEVEQASQPGSSNRPELSVVKVEAGEQELGSVQTQELLVKREPFEFTEGSQSAQGASSHSVTVGGIRIKIEEDSVLDESWKLFSSTVVLRDCRAELQQSGRYCQECRVQFCSRSALADHYMLPTEPTGATNYIGSHLMIHSGKKPFKCNQCGCRCISRSSLIIHIRTHTGEKPFKCDQCQYRCAQKGALKIHLRTHSDTGKKPFKCDQCQYRCSHNVLLVAHKRTHMGMKRYQCDECEFTCSYKTHLVCHKRTHTGEKPFKCDQCQYSCSRNSTLVVHKRTHTGEKPYKCDQCKQSFSQISTLISHKRIHTGEKPFKCDQCDYSCKDRSTMTSHKKIHSIEKPPDPYKCDQCQFSSIFECSIEYHKMIDHNDDSKKDFDSIPVRPVTKTYSRPTHKSSST